MPLTKTTFSPQVGACNLRVIACNLGLLHGLFVFLLLVAQRGPGEPREARKGPGRAREGPGRAREKPREARKGPGRARKGPGRPKEARERPGEAQGGPNLDPLLRPSILLTFLNLSALFRPRPLIQGHTTYESSGLARFNVFVGRGRPSFGWRPGLLNHLPMISQQI